MARPTVRQVVRSVLVGFASLFSFGEPDRHFAEPPAMIEPTVEDRGSREDTEPRR